MSTTERALKRWLIATGIVYAAGAVQFAAKPQTGARALSEWAGEEVADEQPPGLYNSLASAYMATIASLALGAAHAPSRNKNLLASLMVAKAASSAALLYRYRETRRRGFALGAGVDAAILGVTAGLYANLD